MNILDILKADGCKPKYKASTKGGEYGAPCPFCGGKDRFVIQPNQGEGGRWFCRQCGRRGDTIQYLRDFRQMGFFEAAEYVGKDVSSFTPSLPGKRTPQIHWTPRETSPPLDLWQERARIILEDSERWLFESHGFAQVMLGWLRERRGLSEETIRAYRLGLVVKNRFDSHEQWGLEPDIKDDGTNKKIWVPRGLAIPLCQAGSVLRIRIRRPRMDGDPRYYLLRGSDTRAMVLGEDRDVFVVVESELDAILVFQEAGDLVGAIALGNAQARPDQETMKVLNSSKLILVSLDADGAGAKEARLWWLKHFPQARRWPPLDGKDPADMRLAGVNVRDWIVAGLEENGSENQQTEQVDSRGTLDPSFDSTQTQPILEVVKGKSVEAITYLTQTPQAPEHVTCADCHHFSAYPGPNPRQAWGKCLKRGRGRYGCATACEAVIAT